MPELVDIAVLFVARGGDGGLASVKAFNDSIRVHGAGCEYRLIFLAKGWQIREERNQLEVIAATAGAQIIDVPDDGFDWGAYFRAAPLVKENWLCLMNSHSQPAASGWLHLLLSAAKRPGYGLIGATGSWESPRWTRFNNLSLVASLRHAASMLKHARYMSCFATFPNPHVRSTGVVISRMLFSKFAESRQIPRDKHEAHILESGCNGLSNFVLRQGLELGVVGRDGRTYRPSEWLASCTYRISDQPNLLITDNRTRDYESADGLDRRFLELRAWGREVTF